MEAAAGAWAFQGKSTPVNRHCPCYGAMVGQGPVTVPTGWVRYRQAARQPGSMHAKKSTLRPAAAPAAPCRATPGGDQCPAQSPSAHAAASGAPACPCWTCEVGRCQSGRAPSPGSQASSCQRRAPGSMLAPRPTRPAPWHLGDGRRARGEATPDGACHCHCQHLAVPASVHDLSASSRARVFHPSAEVGCRQVARRTGAELPRPTCVV